MGEQAVHHQVLLAGICGRTPAQRVLQLLDQLTNIIGAVQRPARYVTRHEHDPGTIHPHDPRAHCAQPGRGPRISPARQRSQIRCSLSPAISATQPRAQTRPSTRSIRAIIHLPAPSAEKGKRQQGLDSTPLRARPAGPLITNATPKKGQKAARTRPVDNPQPRFSQDPSAVEVGNGEVATVVLPSATRWAMPWCGRAAL